MTVAVPTQTLAVTDRDGRRDRGRWCTDPGRYGRRLGSDCGGISWVDIVFDSFFWRGEGWEIRIKPPLNHTRWTPQIAVKTVWFAAFIYPLSRNYGRGLAPCQPIRAQKSCSGVCCEGGAFLEAGPRVSCIMRNGALWDHLF